MKYCIFLSNSPSLILNLMMRNSLDSQIRLFLKELGVIKSFGNEIKASHRFKFSCIENLIRKINYSGETRLTFQFSFS